MGRSSSARYIVINVKHSRRNSGTGAGDEGCSTGAAEVDSTRAGVTVVGNKLGEKET